MALISPSTADIIAPRAPIAETCGESRRIIGYAHRIPEEDRNSWIGAMGLYRTRRTVGNVMLAWGESDARPMYVARLVLVDLIAEAQRRQAQLELCEGKFGTQVRPDEYSFMALTGVAETPPHDLDVMTMAWWHQANTRLEDVGADIRLPDVTLP
jgi:hypothetical protein